MDKIIKNRRLEAMLEQDMHDGNTNAKFKPPREPGTVRVYCSVCSGTGMMPVEYGPAGATWTDYERCSQCNGAGGHNR